MENFSDIKNWFLNYIGKTYILHSQVKMSEKFISHILTIDKFSEENINISKKDLTKIYNDFSKLCVHYYSTFKSEKMRDELDELAKLRGLSNAYSSLVNSEVKNIFNRLIFSRIHSLSDTPRLLDFKNSNNSFFSNQEKSWIDRYYPNLEMWSGLKNAFEYITSVLNPTKEQREAKKLQEIKGKVNPLIKEAIDEIGENFRITIEKNIYEHSIGLVEKLGHIPSGELFHKYKNNYFLFDIYKDNGQRRLLTEDFYVKYKGNPILKTNQYYVTDQKIVENYDEILKVRALKISKEEITKFLLKMYDKLGGFISELDKKFTVEKTGRNHINNNIYFLFEDGSRIGIKKSNGF